MKVKVSASSVTFKITEHEMKGLLSGSVIEEKVIIGRTHFSMVIDPDPHEFYEDFNTAPLKLILDKAESCLMLCTTPEEIRKLSDMGKNAKGLFAHVDGIDIILQVDVRSDSRPRKP